MKIWKCRNCETNNQGEVCVVCGEKKNTKTVTTIPHKPKSTIFTWANVKTAMKLVLVVIVIIAGSFLFVRTKAGLVKYNELVIQGDTFREQRNFKAAKELYQTAQTEFEPRITSFIPYFMTMQKNRETEILIDKRIDEGIEEIQIYLKADRKFAKHTEELLFDLLDLRETDEELLQYYELWKKGGNVPPDFVKSIIKRKR